MGLKITTPPAREPITTADGMTHLRLEPVCDILTGDTLQGSDFDNTTNPLTVTAAVTNYSSADFVVGRLFQIEDEVLEVTAVSGNDVTFDRGVTNTVVRAHDDGLKLMVADSHTDEIRILIATARSLIEKWEWRAFITQTVTLVLDEWPTRARGGFREALILPRPPLISVTSIQYKDADGATQTVDSSDYIVDTSTDEPGRVVPVSSFDWPTLESEAPNVVTITYQAGYGTTPSDVPDRVKHLIKLLMSELYQNREAQTTIQMRNAPFAIQALLDRVQDERVLELVA